MAASRAQLLAKSVCGSSPKTPGNTALAETVSLPLHITPLESNETDRDPETPHKDPTCTLKKKSGKLVSKRKLFLQNGQSLQINKAKRHITSKFPSIQPPASKTAEPGSKVHYPLTERQQLQYLLEVTAKEVKQDSGSSSNDDLPGVSNKIKKKNISKDNHIEVRIRKRNERGETALHVAAIKSDLEDLIALIKAGALVNAKDNAGWTPLHEACNYGNLRIVQELVWSSADVNSPGYEAITPLHDAVINDHVEVVKFLLDNGADPKLQTSQNYSTSDLARSAVVRSLVSTEDSTKNFYTVAPLFQPSQFEEPYLNCTAAKVNELNGSFCQGSFYNGAFENLAPVHVHVGKKNHAPKVISFEGSQDAEMCVSPQDYGVGADSYSNKKYFHAQSLQGASDFSGNGDNFAYEIGPSDCKESVQLPSTEAEEKNDRINHDEKACHFQQTKCYSSGSAELELDGNAEVVNNTSVMESASMNNVQNLTKDTTSDIPCPNSSEESVATETLVLVNTRSSRASNPGLPVTPETEEDTIAPEKLNECLDKAMIQISSYLETSQKLNVQAPCDSKNLNKNGADKMRGEQNIAVNMDASNKPATINIAAETHLSHDHCPENRQHANSALSRETEQKSNENEAFSNELTVNGTQSMERQPVANFAKVKPRSDKKKEGGSNSKSGRRKRSSTRSSESSKYENNQSTVKEECTSHISNLTWRSDLPELRYSLSAMPLHVPGYEEFLINSKNCKRSKSLLNEITKDPMKENQLDRLISQHDTEKVKLRMTLEQELVRLFGNCACKTAGYHVPYSACTVMTSQMKPLGMKSVSPVERDEPLSIKLEVDKILGKFNRFKAEMLRRHNREIEAVISLGNFWSETEELTEESKLPTRTYKKNDSLPLYFKDFELLPAKFNEYYEEVLCATD